ncbi:MAG: hypothetical protein KGL48_07415 [Sphingomonadales bacterium]|nr:hypothetical protein [Sphingomonadales bacterium]MDE2569152.1 hypothetical protein [Sphingomonadales bacterium]
MTDELQIYREKLQFENAMARRAPDAENARVHNERAAGYARRIDFLLHKHG